MVRTALDTLTETERHRLLADELRRFVIDMLDGRNGPIEASLGELASDIDRANPDISDSAEMGREDLLVRLHHVHLPMLDDLGLIDYERTTKRIRVRHSGGGARVTNRPAVK